MRKAMSTAVVVILFLALAAGMILRAILRSRGHHVYLHYGWLIPGAMLTIWLSMVLYDRRKS